MTNPEPAPGGHGPSPARDNDGLWLGLGFLLFGAALGVTVGLSNVKGISQTLLTSLLTFAAATLLSFAGFRRRSATSATKGGNDSGESADSSALVAKRFGLGVGGFSAGVIAGAFFGMWFRVTDPVGWQEVADARAAKTLETLRALKEATETQLGSVAKVGLGLQSGNKKLCTAVASRLERATYNNPEGCKVAVTDLAKLQQATCEEK